MRDWNLAQRLAVIMLMVSCTEPPRTWGSEPGGPAANSNLASNWPQWRGPHRDGSVLAADWPDQLNSDNCQQVWRVALGPSYSGPIVCGDRVFVTETVDRRREVVRALDRSNGQELWKAEWDGALSVPFFAKSNGDWIRATPAWDGSRLFVAGMRDVLVCLEGQTGQELWRVDFVAQHGSAPPAFGFVSSPLVVGEHVFVQAGGGFTKLQSATGRVVWRVLDDGGGMNGSAFSSPVLSELDGQPVIFVQTRTHLVAVDPESGQTLFQQEVAAFRGMNILTPTIVGDTVFTSSYGGRSVLLRSNRTADQWKFDEQWTHKSQGYMSSPLVIDGHLYMHLRNQRFICLELATGQDKWTTTPFGKYWSLVRNGNKILALDEQGDLRLIHANPAKYEQLGQLKVAEDCWAHLAVSGSELFVRDLAAMIVYRWK